MENNLKTMRKVQKRTQCEVATFIGVSQNAYSYWEKGQVKVDHQSYARLADYFGVSVDFLMGRPYKVNLPPEKWEASLYADYQRENEYVKKYMEFLYGNITFTDSVESRPAENILFIYKLDGSIVEKTLTDKQVQLIENLLEQIC